MAMAINDDSDVAHDDDDGDDVSHALDVQVEDDADVDDCVESRPYNTCA